MKKVPFGIFFHFRKTTEETVLRRETGGDEQDSMNKHNWNRMLSGIVLLLASMLLIACASGDTAAQTDETQTTEMPQETAGLSEGGNGAPVGVSARRLADGTYRVMIHSDLTTDDSGRTWATVSELKCVELDDSEIAKARISDSIQLGDHSFVVRTVELVEEDGVRKILYNNGTEYCVYMPETNTWRFLDASGEPYMCEGERYLMPIAVDATFTDELTPISEGWNVYGMLNDGDPTIGMLDELGDYFRHYPGMEHEYAVVTVLGGEIADVLIEYHP